MQPGNEKDFIQDLFTACGGRLKDPTNYPQAVYHGKRVYFCTEACLRAFMQDPDRFMAGEIEHPDNDSWAN